MEIRKYSSGTAWIKAEGYVSDRSIVLVCDDRYFSNVKSKYGSIYEIVSQGEPDAIAVCLEEYIAEIRPELKGGMISFFQFKYLTRTWDVVYHHPGLRTVPDGELEPLVRLHPLRAGEILSPLSTMTTEIPWREGYNPKVSTGVVDVTTPTLDGATIGKVVGYINYPNRMTTATHFSPNAISIEALNAPNENECSPIKVRIAEVNPPTGEDWEPPIIREEPPT